MRPSGPSRMIALFAALALIVPGLLPAAHVHAGDAGATVLHRHALDTSADRHGHDADRHDDTLGSGRQAEARFLRDEYLAPMAFSLSGPRVVRFEIPDPPAHRVAHRADRTTLLPTHDPPIRHVSSPAPPVSL